MKTLSRRTLLAGLALCSLPAAAATDEAALRQAMRAYERAWNRRDIAAWKDLVTADLHYQESYLHTDPDRQMTTRERSLRAIESGVKAFDFKWEPLRVHKKPDGSVTAVMRVVQLALPRINGKYTATFETNPAIARWRVEDGRWKLYHYVTYAPYAKEIVNSEGLMK